MPRVRKAEAMRVQAVTLQEDAGAGAREEAGEPLAIAVQDNGVQAGLPGRVEQDGRKVRRLGPADSGLQGRKVGHAPVRRHPPQGAALAGRLQLSG